MSDTVILCDEPGCALPAVILVAGVGYCTAHALKQVRRIPRTAEREQPKPQKRKRRAWPRSSIEETLES